MFVLGVGECNVHPYRVKVTDIRQCQDNLLGRSFVCGVIGVILSSSNHNLSLCAYSTGLSHLERCPASITPPGEGILRPRRCSNRRCNNPISRAETNAIPLPLSTISHLPDPLVFLEWTENVNRDGRKASPSASSSLIIKVVKI